MKGHTSGGFEVIGNITEEDLQEGIFAESSRQRADETLSQLLKRLDALEKDNKDLRKENQKLRAENEKLTERLEQIDCCCEALRQCLRNLFK